MKKNSILIIGNSPKILNNKFGIEINKFSDVARINNYRINNYQSYIGSKTTIWINGANKHIKKPTNIPKDVIIFIPHYLLRDKYDRIIQRTPKRLKLDPQKFSIINKEKIKNYERISGVNRPSTGLYAILWSLENYKTVIIHGFNFFEDSNNHYFDSKIKKMINNFLFKQKYNNDKYHDFKAEKLYVNTLVKDKKIITLTDYLK